ncbi:hypothetical protein [Allorhizocola rhizosphaerae]|uniref:hypothetical protein n=1 Tax=Allorhizocola rhizosphaerae TaxID=1872709 RepID=UPI000E3BF379|nr:hypothetical protein [Allorhizocola rhizosphaerae]
MNDTIRAEVARAELDELGAKHFVDVRATVRRMLEEASHEARTHFALSVAERTLSREQHPKPELTGLLQAIKRDSADDVAVGVGRFYLSPQWRGKHDDHTAMAVFYTAECHLHGCLEFACWTGWRGFDSAAAAAAADVVWPHRRPVEISLYAWELAHPAIQSELESQLAVVESVSTG